MLGFEDSAQPTTISMRKNLFAEVLAPPRRDFDRLSASFLHSSLLINARDRTSRAAPTGTYALGNVDAWLYHSQQSYVQVGYIPVGAACDVLSQALTKNKN